MCTRTVGTICHVLEAEGLATVGIASIRPLAERLHAPRTLYCEFPLGRPLGRPGDPAFQRRVLSAAFDLLGRTAGPVLEDFPEKIEADLSEQLSCAVPPRVDPSLPAPVDEAIGLLAAYERQLAATGRTAVGRALSTATIPDAIGAFVRIAEGVPLKDAGLAANPTDTALDIRAYYEEAALALADHVPGARATQTWFFNHTKTGATLRQAQARLRDAGVDKDIWMVLTPYFDDMFVN
jgi:hypothetical protein